MDTTTGKEPASLTYEELVRQMDETFEFCELLDKETDRGCALVAAASLDTALRTLLCAAMVNERESAKFTGPNGPLDTFSARINAAYVFGLIGPLVRRDLDYIRKIRNEFAHDPAHLDFSNDRIRGFCQQLRHFVHSRADNARHKFVNTVSGLHGIIWATTKSRQRPAPAVEMSDIALDQMRELVKTEAHKIKELRAAAQNSTDGTSIPVGALSRKSQPSNKRSGRSRVKD